jgi:hypothetical protein
VEGSFSFSLSLFLWLLTRLIKQGNSPGVNACLIDPHHVLLLNLLPKSVHPQMRIKWNPLSGAMDASIVEPQQQSAPTPKDGKKERKKVIFLFV